MAKIKHHINKSKRIARSCKNNGSCSWCRDSRLHNSDKKKAEADFTVDDLFLDPTQDILPILHFNLLERLGEKSEWKDTFKWKRLLVYLLGWFLLLFVSLLGSLYS